MTTLTVLRRLWPLAAVTILLGLASVAAAYSSLEFTRLDGTSGPPPEMAEYVQPTPQSAMPQQVADAESSDLVDLVTTVAGWLCVAVGVVLGGLLVRLVVRDLMRRRANRSSAPGRPSGAATAQEVVDALDAGLVELSDSDTDPRRAVIACWVRLEQTAAAAGLPRQVGDTPTDLVSRLLRARASVSADVLAEFAHVYREARYATRVVDERMRGQARSALQRLRAELTAEVGAGMPHE
ncbi:hypothetical protein GCM10027290_08900 [Micromonospora sonneratiae]|uniref:DUF4129 domain-containing protein n=1 Tax=Micromonospora sonneratiae TaxID=1184706 RepID=A0ABW3YHQ2_9ACTN